MTTAALFDGLDRAGPGDAASVGWAVGAAGTRAGAAVLEAGCGAGGAYGVGVTAGLLAWRQVLAWAVWVAEAAELADAAALEAEVTAAGYRVLDACGLGRKAWAADYEPLAARLEAVPTGAEYGYRLIVAEAA